MNNKKVIIRPASLSLNLGMNLPIFPSNQSSNPSSVSSLDQLSPFSGASSNQLSPYLGAISNQLSPYSSALSSNSAENEQVSSANEDPFDSSQLPSCSNRPDVTDRPNPQDQPHQIHSLPPPALRSRLVSETIDELLICEEHNNSKDFFCSDCTKDLCSECITRDHQGHTYQPTMTYKDWFAETENRIKILLNISSAVDNELSGLTKKKCFVANNIKSYFAEIRKQLNQREQKLMKDLNFVVTCRAQALSEKLRETHETVNVSLRIMDKLGDKFQCGDMEFIDQNGPLAKKHLETLRRSTRSSQIHVEEDDLFFIPTNNEIVRKFVNELGIVSSSSYVASITCNNLRSALNDNGFSLNTVNGNIDNVVASTSTSAATTTTFPIVGAAANSNNVGGGFSDTNGTNGFNSSNNFSSGMDNFNGMNSINGNFGRDQFFYDNNSGYHLFQNSTTINSLRSPGVRTVSIGHNRTGAVATLTPTESSDFSVLPIFTKPGNNAVSNSRMLSPRNPRNAIVPILNMNMASTSTSNMNTNRSTMNRATKVAARSSGTQSSNPNNERTEVPVSPNCDRALFSVSHHTNRHYNRIRRPVFVFGREGPGDKELCRPWGVCCDSKGHIVVADRSNNRIQVFRTDGSHVRHFGHQGIEKGEFNRPAGVAIDIDGNIIVCDKDNHRVQIFSMEGHFLNMFGERGTVPGKFHYPWDVDVHKESGTIAITDTRNHRVQIFSSKGDFVTMFGFDNNSPTWKFFDSPRGIAFSSPRTILVTDFNNHRLFEIYFDKHHAQMINLEIFRNCELYRPQGVTVDKEHNILISDCRNNRIQVYGRSGKLVGQFGVPGKEVGQFDRPSGIAMTPEGKIAVVDFGNHRVQVF